MGNSCYFGNILSPISCSSGKYARPAHPNNKINKRILDDNISGIYHQIENNNMRLNQDHSLICQFDPFFFLFIPNHHSNLIALPFFLPLIFITFAFPRTLQNVTRSSPTIAILFHIFFLQQLFSSFILLLMITSRALSHCFSPLLHPTKLYY